jgi:hypothetical protein
MIALYYNYVEDKCRWKIDICCEWQLYEKSN